MDHLKQAATQTKVAVSLPSQWINMYGDFITKNAGAVGQVEGALRSLTYIIPGGFKTSDIASESLNSSVQLLAMYHDSLLSRALQHSLRSRHHHHHQTPHSRYTRFYCQKSTTYRRTATALHVIQYTELLLEMLAKRRSETSRWRLVIALESLKATCRLILLHLTHSRPLLTPPLPERELLPEDASPNPDDALNPFDDDHALPSPPSEPSSSALSLAGSEKWSMPRTSLTLPPLPSSTDISSYLLSKVLTADDIKPPKALLPRTAGLGALAELMHILRPVIYAAALAYWTQRGGGVGGADDANKGRGKRDWRPWVLGITLEYGARQLARRELDSRRPGGASRGLTGLERDEIAKRGWALAWWAMRGAFFEDVTRPLIRRLVAALRGKPLLDLVGNFVEDYDFLWDQYYFPTATM